MPHESPLEARVSDLELKLNVAEDLVDELNKLLFRQQQQIDLLVREVLELKHSQSKENSVAPLSLIDERPPHY